MVVFFIEKSNNSRFFKKIEINKDRIIIHANTEKINKKLMSRINKILDKNNCKKVIISNKLKQNKMFLNSLYSNNIDICDGKKLYKKLIQEIIIKICNKEQLNPKQCQIAITVNYLDGNVTKLIDNLSKKFKVLNIVSNNMDSFKQIKEKLYENNGIIITVTNNKRKALLKSGLIVNYDFSEEVLNKYVIKDNAIIINTEAPINIHKKRFIGKIINDIDISFVPSSKIALELKKEKYNIFDLKDLAEIYVTKYPEEINNTII